MGNVSDDDLDPLLNAHPGQKRKQALPFPIGCIKVGASYRQSQQSLPVTELRDVEQYRNAEVVLNF